MQAAGKDEEPITAINVTPLVDVSLVLVIIFMVTTPFMTQSKLTVTLPKAATDEAKNEEYVTITIDKKGDISVNEKQVFTPKELEAVLARKLAATKDNTVIIKADLDIDHGTVIDAMDTAKKVKPKKIYFATQQKKD
ncbi:MAG TPA: biopolymer transporter ExbD [Candidatus Goldiibacteriota bacterium]|nr:biopolymer transporter ExbD [Candidatus Goldiibacteriota bacterium]